MRSTRPTEGSPLVAGKTGGIGLKESLKRPDFLLIWLAPFAIYLATSFLWAYDFLAQPLVCIIMTTITLNICLALMMWKRTELGGDRPWFPKVGTHCLIACLLGSFIGLYVYDTCTLFPQLYANGRKYTNVLPSQPAAAVSDAGKIVFSTGSFVDTAKSVGLVEEDGVKYCIAPVTDGGGDRVQFWAVGVGCCGAKGEFYCDEVGDAGAKSGIVVFDTNGYFQQSNRDLYAKAMKKALATYGLQSVADPVYVRWVKEADLNMLANYYGGKGILSLLIGAVIFLLVSLAMALAPPGTPALSHAEAKHV